LLFLCSKLFRVFLLRSFFFNVVASSNLKLHFSHLISIKNLLFFLNQIPSTKKTHFWNTFWLKYVSEAELFNVRYMHQKKFFKAKLVTIWWKVSLCK
jgi:hypothetical protein